MDSNRRPPLVFKGNHKAKNGIFFPIEISSSCLEYEGEGYAFLLVSNITDRIREGQIKTLVSTAAIISEELTVLVSGFSETAKVATLSDLGFSPRQIEITQSVIQGDTSKSIAIRLEYKIFSIEKILLIFMVLYTTIRI